LPLMAAFPPWTLEPASTAGFLCAGVRYCLPWLSL
jgi:hypothetical protein